MSSNPTAESGPDDRDADHLEPAEAGLPADGDPDGDPENEDEPEELDPDGQLAEILGAPDRDRCPGARPVVSVAEEDDSAFIAEVNARCVAAPTLRRRGHFHGNWAELDDHMGFFPQDPLPSMKERWEAARPIVLHDALPDSVMEIVRSHRRQEALSHPGGLQAFLTEKSATLEPEFAPLPPAIATPNAAVPTGADERDIEKCFLRWESRTSRDAEPVDNLWLKTQRLSTHADDQSLRLAVAFGEEGAEDASRDHHRHRLVSQLAERLFPELIPLHQDHELRGLIGEWTRSRPIFTQTIAYWNAPNAGALFHHDAFDEPHSGRQRGVLYAQLTGATAWLALSISDLAERVLEFVDLLEEGVFGELKDHLLGVDETKQRFMKIFAERESLEAELALPGCGRLARLVNQGPEFTALLADAGHGFVVSEGDVIVLPNHGYVSTCMHSVFCASEEPAFSFSMAIRDSEHGSGSKRGGKAAGRRRTRGRGSRQGPRGAGARGSSSRSSRPGSKRKRR